MITALDIAKWFLASIDRDAGDSITHLKLQKLVYYAQAWSLALLDRELFAEDFQAWAHGPVVESVYHEYKASRWDALPEPAEAPELDEDVDDFLDDILDVYGDYSAKHLEVLTHQEEPWRQARGNLPPESRCNRIISKQVMKQYYRNLYDAQNGEEP